jgi:biotin carboxyl carrier protein
VAERARRSTPKISRSPDDRLADHEAIDRMTDELLPALMAKLGASGLGELEVREGDWKVRLRRPGSAVEGGSAQKRRASDRPRAQPGHSGHGHPPAAVETHRPGRDGRAVSSGNGEHPATPKGAQAPGSAGRRTVATSPAVGIYSARSDIRPGAWVRAGDRLGSVDVLGVPQEVVAPVDGVLGASLVESGDAVEYGQELVLIELAGVTSGGGQAEAGRPPSSGAGSGGPVMES